MGEKLKSSVRRSRRSGQFLGNNDAAGKGESCRISARGGKGLGSARGGSQRGLGEKSEQSRRGG